MDENKEQEEIVKEEAVKEELVEEEIVKEEAAQEEASQEKATQEEKAQEETQEGTVQEKITKEVSAKEEFTRKVSSVSEQITLTAEVNEYYCYALQQNHGIPLIRNIVIKNDSKEDLEDVLLRIETDTELLEPYVEQIDMIQASATENFERIDISVHGNFLASVEETMKCNLKVSLLKDGAAIVSSNTQITVLPYDQWPGSWRYPAELLAAYSMPSHPVVSAVLKEASEQLKEWTGDEAIAGYQVGQEKRVLEIAKAIYFVIQKKNITYITAPASFEDAGQKVRFPDEILEFHQGTCMDLTLLYTACLETAGLHPLYVLVKGHIYAAVWLKENGTFGCTCEKDASKVKKFAAEGIHQLLLINCVDMASNITFEEAVASGDRYLENPNHFECAVDIERARFSGIKPIPYRVKSQSGYSLVFDERDMSRLHGRDTINLNPIDLSDVNTNKKEMTKLMQWEHKLLDLSAKNILVNTRERRVITIMAPSLGDIEDALADESEFVICPLLDEMIEHVRTTENKKVGGGRLLIGYEKNTVFDQYVPLIDKDVKNHVLHSNFLDEVSLKKELRRLYNENASALEETGNNILYLTLGMLRWTDDAHKKKNYYSPIILVPIDIVNKSAAKGYTIKKRDSDTIVNMTLLELLKEQFEMEIPGVDILPEDEHGVDVPKILAIVRQAIMNKTNWDVVEACTIGAFSFGQIVMWSDVHSHPEIFENHKIVKSLITGKTEWDTTIPEKVDTDIPYLPVSCDASQLRAVNMAANDVSFILQGPPGTGKSQTITAMIANALMREKKVLFVAEKRAALDVVHNRLKDIGLEDFCLEIYSNKATKRSVLNQIGRNMEHKDLGTETEYRNKLAEINKRKEELDGYANALHTPTNCGMSLKQLIDAYEGIDQEIVHFKLSDEIVDSCDAYKMEHYKEQLERLVTEGRRIGHPSVHKLSFVGASEYSQSFKRKLEDDLYAWTDAIQKTKETSEKTAVTFGVSVPVSAEDWNRMERISDALLASTSLPAFLLNAPSLDAEFAYPENALNEWTKFQTTKNNFMVYWDERIESFNVADFTARLKEANNKMLGKNKAIEALQAELSAYFKGTGQIVDLNAVLGQISAYQAEKARVYGLFTNMPIQWKPMFQNGVTADAFKKYKNQIIEQRRKVDAERENVIRILNGGSSNTALNMAKMFLEQQASLKQSKKEVYSLLEMEEKVESTDYLGEQTTICESFMQDASGLRDWMNYRAEEKKCEELGLKEICTLYRKGTSHDYLIPSFFVALYKGLIWKIVEGNASLDTFTGETFNARIKEFKNADDELIKVTREEILYQLRLRTPAARASIEKGKNGQIISRAIKNGGRGMTIRSLFDQTFNTITTCCPCMLMSPLSVAQYISPQNDLFDLVIFDEASQLPTSRAVGVIARAKNAIVVGDPKQMPPTSFFMGKYEDLDNIDLEDLESILDDCEVTGMPNTRLRWHYRSRHESLIAFSNRNYYENSMFTFPSVNDRERRVTLVKVNGRKIGNINEREATKVVEEVLHRYHDEELRKSSLGIVTFNISQCEYIKKLLVEEYAKDPDFEIWATTGEDPLFVKNLENVQGDERDVILFSVTFGLDEDERLSINFGPLNKDGGWRRLNVAVSRSKYEMVVFSSMTGAMIETKHPTSEGAKGLCAFLKYAESGILPEVEEEKKDIQVTPGIQQKICEALTEAGYQYKTDLGYSEFKIDIAVVNPNNSDEYLLGIMTDGDSYRLAGNTRDREVAQFSVLKGLGWNLQRVWTMDWWDDSNREIQKILDRLEELKQNTKSEKKEHWYPESEEIIYKEPDEKKKRSSDNGKVEVFLSDDRFQPNVPHTDSMEELQNKFKTKE